MLPVRESTKKSWYGDRDIKHISITLNELMETFDEGSIVADSFKLVQSISEGEDVTLCGCIASRCEFELDTDMGIEDSSISISMRSGDTEEIPIFNGFITEAKKGTYKNTQKVTCYDALYYMDKDATLWYSQQPRQTMNSLLTNLLDACGIFRHETRSNLGNMGFLTVDCGALLPEYPNLLPQSTTYLGILRSICTACGVFGFMGREGKFETKFVSNMGEDEIIVPWHNACTMDDYDIIPPDAVISCNGESIIPDGTDLSPCIGGNQTPLNPYIVRGNIVALSFSPARRQPMVDNLYDAMSNLTFTPFEAEIPSIPFMWMGDKIFLEDEDGTYPFIVLSRTLSLHRDFCMAEGTRHYGEGEGNSTGSVSPTQGGLVSVVIDASDKMDKVNPKGSGKLSINRRTASSEGGYSMAVGDSTVASGMASVALGGETQATQNYAYAEGDRTISSGYASHSEGYKTSAGAQGAHSEGLETSALGKASHAGGEGTEAYANHETAIGRFNVKNRTDSPLFVVGNGTSDSARSDAFAVLPDGTVQAQNDVEIVGGMKLSEAIKASDVPAVSVSQTLTTGTEIAEITVGAESTKLYAPNGGGGGSVVSVNAIRTTGDHIADITVDGTPTGIYAIKDYDELTNSPIIQGDTTSYWYTKDAHTSLDLRSDGNAVIHHTAGGTMTTSRLITDKDLGFFEFLVPANGIVTITKRSGQQFALKISSMANTLNALGEWLVGSNTAGSNIYIKNTVAASLVNVAKIADNKITITSTHNSSIRFICWYQGDNIYEVT